MKKTLSLILTAVLLLTCCSFAFAEEKTVLKIACWDRDTTAYYGAMKEGFEAAHPDVDVEFIDLASQEYAILASANLASGDNTDLYCIKELSDLQNWVSAGYLYCLNDKIAESGYATDKYAGMEQCYKYVGTDDLYGLPFRADFWVLFYNKDIFDAKGAAYPTNDMTWDEYAALAKSLSGDGIYGTHYHTWLSAVANWAVCDGINTLADGEYSDLKYFYELYQDLEDSEACMSYDELKASGLHYSGAFAQGNIAMLPMGYWYAATMISYIKDGTADFNWGIAAVPHLEGVAAGSSFGSPTAMSINAKSEHTDLAWEFLAWLCSEEGAKALAVTGTRPAYVSEEVAAVMASADGFPTDETSLGALLPTAISLEWPIGEGVNEIKAIVNEEHTLIMTRELSIDEAIAEMEARAAEYLVK